MKFLRIKLQSIWTCLTQRHWFLVSLDSEELERSFLGRDFEAHLITHRLNHYNVRHLSSIVSGGFDQEREFEVFKEEAKARGHIKPNWTEELQKAIESEDYERAAQIRDFLKRSE